MSILKKLLILIFLFVWTATAQQKNLRLKTIGPEQGLPSIRVNTVYQDSYQFLWIGTEVGLKQFDGYQLRSVGNHRNTINPLNNEPIRSLLQDHHDRLWIGTVNVGLGYLDLSDHRFFEIGPFIDGAQLEVRDLTLGKNQILWVATWRGLFRIDTRADSLHIEQADSKNMSIRCLTLDNSGDLWVGTENQGLYKWSTENDSLIRFDVQTFPDHRRIYSVLQIDDQTFMAAMIERIVIFNPKTGFSEEINIRGEFDSGEITSLVMDRKGGVWAGSANVGLIYFPAQQYTPVLFDGRNEYGETLKASGILNLFLDQQGKMWVSTRGAGLQVFDPETPFTLFSKDNGSGTGISDPSIRSIVKDDKYLWVGSYGGLDRFSIETGVRKHFDHVTADGLLPNKNVYSLVKDDWNDLWIGTEGGGLFQLPNQKEQIRAIDIGYGGNEEARQVYELLVTRDSLLLVGTGNGLYEIKLPYRKNIPIKRIPLELERTNALDGEDIFALRQGSDGSIWVGTRAVGLYRLAPNYELRDTYVYSNGNLNSLASNQIKCIHEDQKGRVWVGTQGGGLNRVNLEDGDFFHITEQHGLADNTIYGILEDEEGRLWVSTNQGISSYDPETEIIENFGLEYGLQSSEFNTGAFYQSKDGEMFFGGIEGLNSFYPEAVYSHSNPLKVTLTDFLVNNRSIHPGSFLLPEDISMLNEVTISHKETLITLEFSAMNFIDPEGTEYRYQLHGVTQGWIEGESNYRKATFTNPSSGTHLFEIQARRSQNHSFGPVKQLQIRVKPAPWKSPGAIILYLLVILGILLNVRQNEIKKINLQSELERNRQEAQKLGEIDEMKSRLISNVSHELRTPLTLLVGHIDNLNKTAKSTLSPAASKSLNSAKRSVVRVTELSDQLFDLARFASGKITLKASRYDLVEELTEIVEDFRVQYKSNGHRLIFKQHIDHLPIYLDISKFEQVLFNLLSNAMKFSDENTDITIELFDDLRARERGVGSFAIIRVSNIGRGIPSSSLGNVFDRLYQIDTADSEEKGGAGIGLALVKELVELHGGSIRVSSEPHGETSFEFTIPKGVEHLSPDEIVDLPEKITPETVLDDGALLTDLGKSKILVVEDDDELRGFIATELNDTYTVITSPDGVQGLEVAREELPDLILSDVNMPLKDGLQLLRDVREDKILSHVPMILLTGQTSPQDRAKGYEGLVNDYIGKPFKMEELKIRIESIFRNQQQLMNKFKDEGLHSPFQESSLSKNDDRFLAKLKELIDNNLAKTDLTVDDLAKGVFMSKRQLERKTKDITGQTPAELIRQVRLVRAKQYLNEGTFATVSEISHAVGFKNVKYFSRLYKNQFNQSPTDILRS